jgi:hypothetical protein
VRALYCDAGQLVPCCVDHQRFASREGDAELKPRLVQEALAEQPGQLLSYTLFERARGDKLYLQGGLIIEGFCTAISL